MANLKIVTAQGNKPKASNKTQSHSNSEKKSSIQEMVRKVVEDFYSRHGKAMSILAHE